MKLLLLTVAITITSFASVSFGQEEFSSLFDGKTLDGWTAAREGTEFSVNEEERAIHVYATHEAGSKQKTNCLTTDTEYSHFVLKLEYKWLEKRFAPRSDWDRDAGLLFHVHGDRTKVWPLSLEMQIGESPGDKPDARGKDGRFHTGDLFVLGKDLRTDTAFRKENGKHFFDKTAEVKKGKSVRTSLGVEKSKGEWNEMEIHVHGSEKAVFMFNGEVVLETTNFTQKDKDGDVIPLEKGRIGLQAEWAELLYRNIRIKELPAK